MQQTHGNIYENVCFRKECAANERVSIIEDEVM